MTPLADSATFSKRLPSCMLMELSGFGSSSGGILSFLSGVEGSTAASVVVAVSAVSSDDHNETGGGFASTSFFVISSKPYSMGSATALMVFLDEQQNIDRAGCYERCEQLFCTVQSPRKYDHGRSKMSPRVGATQGESWRSYSTVMYML